LKILNVTNTPVQKNVIDMKADKKYNVVKHALDVIFASNAKNIILIACG
jgi:hypothetical protein